MKRGADHVEALEDRIREVQRPGGPDLQLHPPEDPERRQLAIERLDFSPLALRFLLAQALGHAEPEGVVGDDDVGVAAGHGGLGHLPQGGAAVRVGGVQVEVSLHVGEREQSGQPMRGRQLDLAFGLAQLGGNPVEAQGGVDLLLGG
ncbi:hypothetical protein D3C86_1739460 [compost metagenome]